MQVGITLQSLLETDVNVHLGAKRYERGAELRPPRPFFPYPVEADSPKLASRPSAHRHFQYGCWPLLLK